MTVGPVLAVPTSSTQSANSSPQSCTQACAIALPLVLLSLLALGLLFAYFKYRRYARSTRNAPPLKSAVAAGSAPVRTGHSEERGTYAQRVRGWFGKREGKSGRRELQEGGSVDLEAGREVGHGRSGSVGSELTLAETLAEGEPGLRKMEA